MKKKAKVILLEKLPDKKRFPCGSIRSTKAPAVPKNKELTDLGHKGWEDTFKKFHHAGWLTEEKKDSRNKSILVTLTAAGKQNQEKRAKRKGEVLKSHEVWVRYRENLELCKEEACRAEDAAREARETSEKNLALMLEKDDMLKEDTRLIADKTWQAFQTTRKRKT